MAISKPDASAAGQRALDKLEAAEALSRFYAAVQHYDTDSTHWDEIAALIAPAMVYLTPNLSDRRPVPREEFLRHFRELHDVHAHGQRGSFYALSGLVATVTSDEAHVIAHAAIGHWLSPANEHSTWFYGPVEARLVRSDDGWLISLLDVSTTVRVEGHFPPVNAFHPHLPDA